MAQRSSGGVYARRKSALARLEHQLTTGNKPVCMPPGTFSKDKSTMFVELTDTDVTRINKEIEKLKSKL